MSIADRLGKEEVGEESYSLELRDVPTKGTRSISTGEDVLVHEETPDEVLELPVPPEAGNLEVKDAIVLEPLVDDGADVVKF